MTRDRAVRAVRIARALIGDRLIEIVEARTTRWLFDRIRRWTLRLPPDSGLDVGMLALPWQRYAPLALYNHVDGMVLRLDGAGPLRLHAIPDG